MLIVSVNNILTIQNKNKFKGLSFGYDFLSSFSVITFQNLLKRQLRNQIRDCFPMNNRKTNDQKHSYARSHRLDYAERGTNFQFTNQTPRQLKYPQNMQTPVFFDKMRSEDLQVEEFEQQSCRVGQGTNEQLSDSEPQSQVLSVNDMNADYFHPMILSNINTNCKPNINRLQLLRLRNEVQDLRQTQNELMQYMEDQKPLIEYIGEKLCLEVDEFVMEFVTKLKRGSHQQGTNQVVNQYENKLRQKNQEIQQLNNNAYERQSQIDQLVLENQSIQEHVFDMEQKIVGIDLEVERQIKERLKNMPQNVLKRQHQNQSHLIKEHAEQIERLNQQIIILQQKCHKYEEMSLIQSQLIERTKTIRQVQLNYQRKQANLRQMMAKIQSEQQLIQIKNNQILTTEQNLSKKITDLRNKQSELSQWQSQLTKKATEMRNMNNIVNQFTEDLNHTHQDPHKSGISMKTFGINKNNHQQQKREKPFTDYHENHSRVKVRPQYTHEEELAIRKNKISEILEREKYDHNQKQQWQSMALEKKFLETTRRPEHRPSIEANFLHSNGLEGTNASNTRYLPGASSKYRESRQTSPYAHLNELSKSRTQQLNHHFNLAKNSISQFKDGSKNSRKSMEKTIGVKNLQSSRLSRHAVNEGGELSGLGSKLQRLRQQLKKEIQSMK